MYGHKDEDEQTMHISTITGGVEDMEAGRDVIDSGGAPNINEGHESIANELPLEGATKTPRDTDPGNV